MAKPNSQRTWYVYILECCDQTYYTGIALNVAKRMDQHNGQDPGGAKYTQTRRPVKLLYKKRLPDQKTAMTEELRIKRLPRKQKMELIKAKTKHKRSTKQT